MTPAHPAHCRRVDLAWTALNALRLKLYDMVQHTDCSLVTESTMNSKREELLTSGIRLISPPHCDLLQGDADNMMTTNQTHSIKCGYWENADWSSGALFFSIISTCYPAAAPRPKATENLISIPISSPNAINKSLRLLGANFVQRLFMFSISDMVPTAYRAGPSTQLLPA
jgi:hypothetical protein